MCYVSLILWLNISCWEKCDSCDALWTRKQHVFPYDLWDCVWLYGTEEFQYQLSSNAFNCTRVVNYKSWSRRRAFVGQRQERPLLRHHRNGSWFITVRPVRDFYDTPIQVMPYTKYTRLQFDHYFHLEKGTKSWITSFKKSFDNKVDQTKPLRKSISNCIVCLGVSGNTSNFSSWYRPMGLGMVPFPSKFLLYRVVYTSKLVAPI